MSWLPLKIPAHCKIVVSCTYEEGNPALMQDLRQVNSINPSSPQDCIDYEEWNLALMQDLRKVNPTDHMQLNARKWCPTPMRNDIQHSCKT